jgi:hydroxypyruvate isomerase
MHYPNIAKAIYDMGYRGPVGMEAFAKGDPEAALAAFRNAFTIEV